MSNQSRVFLSDGADGNTVSFIDLYVESERFSELFRDGMTLVEETARYLDGDGRRQGRQLNGQSSLNFATESMRLTTRLMNLASWLLMRRSVARGEMTRDKAKRERTKLKLETIGRPSHLKDYEELPAELRALVDRSFAMHDKITRLDRMFEVGADSANAEIPQVNLGLEKIRLAFVGGKPIN